MDELHKRKYLVKANIYNLVEEQYLSKQAKNAIIFYLKNKVYFFKDF